MSAQYYYIDPGTQDTHGPVSLADMQALYDGSALTGTTFICRVVMEEWGPPEAYPELLPTAATPVPEPMPAPAPAPASESVQRRSNPWLVRALAVVGACALLYAAGAFLGLWKYAVPMRPMQATAASTTPQLPAPSGTAPAADPARTPDAPATGNVVRGTDIAIRLLEKYPKLKVAVISGMVFPKPDGIELYGTGAHGASVSFLIPDEEWSALSDEEKLDLQAYVAAKVSWVREHAEDYMIIPKDAPVYAKNLDRARHLVDGAWRISNTETFPDDPDGNLYLKTILVKGPAY